jgi:uncharacterized membrane protein YkvA (DUF1232 family)
LLELGERVNSKLKDFVMNTFVKIAQDLVQNPEGLKFKLKKAVEKLNKDAVKDALGKYWADVQTFIRLIRAWVTRKYTDVSTQTIVYATMAVIYFLNPTDFIPDIIIGLGFIDDIAVISWVLNTIKEDLIKFKAWEESQKTEAEDKES